MPHRRIGERKFILFDLLIGIFWEISPLTKKMERELRQNEVELDFFSVFLFDGCLFAFADGKERTAKHEVVLRLSCRLSSGLIDEETHY